MSETSQRGSVPSPRVKICGITDLHDAELAVELGAWAIGMVFYESSPRQCSIEQARQITAALHRRVELCGVFVDGTLDELTRRTEELGLTMLQLHGDEGPAFCAEVARRTGAHVVKAVQVADIGDVRKLERYHVDFHLADARAQAPGNKDLQGGTGETFDWGLLAGRRSETPLVLSGGLHPGNVAEAIELVHPHAVDTASGTERAPGHKDETKLRAFFAAVGSSRTRENRDAVGAGDGAGEGIAAPAEGAPA